MIYTEICFLQAAANFLAEQDEQSNDFEASVMDKRKIMGLQDSAADNTSEGRCYFLNDIFF